ncbi:hypothetical protein FN846DRAFT_910438 [Sphaerosporella brunnea]|uniref:Uncharacterized protein n=1 Tax=Sphaerosporella brunnea TaxID=1250544 RepID=A0A5J5EN88_9PEZI|nr:hypothetical protein FN846DRAFT_910438 [Sphaerosporella brunnea]
MSGVCAPALDRIAMFETPALRSRGDQVQREERRRYSSSRRGTGSSGISRGGLLSGASSGTWASIDFDGVAERGLFWSLGVYGLGERGRYPSSRRGNRQLGDFSWGTLPRALQKPRGQLILSAPQTADSSGASGSMDWESGGDTQAAGVEPAARVFLVGDFFRGPLPEPGRQSILTASQSAGSSGASGSMDWESGGDTQAAGVETGSLGISRGGLCRGPLPEPGRQSILTAPQTAGSSEASRSIDFVGAADRGLFWSLGVYGLGERGRYPSSRRGTGSSGISRGGLLSGASSGTWASIDFDGVAERGLFWSLGVYGLGERGRYPSSRRGNRQLGDFSWGTLSGASSGTWASIDFDGAADRGLFRSLAVN